MKRRRLALTVALGLAAASWGGTKAIRAGDDAKPAAPAAGRRVDEAIESSLDWLAREQRPDGSWGADDASTDSGADDVSATSLALLACFNAGYSHRSEGRFGRVVGQAIKWLRSRQDDDGLFRPRDRVGSRRHDALATVALVESYGMTGAEIHRAITQRALDALATTDAAKPPASASDGPSLDAFGWAVSALAMARGIVRSETKAGKEATLRVDDRAFAPARAWLDAADTARARDPSAIATRILVRASIGYGKADLDALRRDVLGLAAHPVPTRAEDDLPGRVAAIAQIGANYALSGEREAWYPRGRAWQRAALRDGADAGGLRGSYDERGPLATRTGRVEATAYGYLAQWPFCTAYLPRFPGTEPAPEPETAPAPPSGMEAGMAPEK